MTLSERIRDARRASGMTQEDVAKKLNVAIVMVSRWENGQEPRVHTLQRLAMVLGVTLDTLIGDK